MVQQVRHRESVTVVMEEARRHFGGIHGDLVNPEGATEIDVEFPDLVAAAQFASAVRAVFAVEVDLRDPVSSLWSTVTVTVTVTDAVHHHILRRLR